MVPGPDHAHAKSADPAVRRRRFALEAELRRLLPLLVDEGVLRLVLYGSLCHGAVHAASDLDLLVVVPPGAPPLPVRLARLYGRLAPQLPCDILAYTPAELQALAALPGPVAEALAQGRTVYGRPVSAGP